MDLNNLRILHGEEDIKKAQAKLHDLCDFLASTGNFRMSPKKNGTTTKYLSDSEGFWIWPNTLEKLPQDRFNNRFGVDLCDDTALFETVVKYGESRGVTNACYARNDKGDLYLLHSGKFTKERGRTNASDFSDYLDKSGNPVKLCRCNDGCDYFVVCKLEVSNESFEQLKVFKDAVSSYKNDVSSLSNSSNVSKTPTTSVKKDKFSIQMSGGVVNCQALFGYGFEVHKRSGGVCQLCGYGEGEGVDFESWCQLSVEHLIGRSQKGYLKDVKGLVKDRFPELDFFASEELSKKIDALNTVSACQFCNSLTSRNVNSLDMEDLLGVEGSVDEVFKHIEEKLVEVLRKKQKEVADKLKFVKTKFDLEVKPLLDQVRTTS